MGNWSKLKADEKIRVIKFARQNGVSDINTIRDTYNLYSKGGNLAHKKSGEEQGENQELQNQQNISILDLIRQKLYRHIYPSGYQDAFQRIVGALMGKDDVLHTAILGYGSASAEIQNSENAKRKQYLQTGAFADGQTKYRDDIFATYLGIPQSERRDFPGRISLISSQYKPTKNSKGINTPYYTFPKENIPWDKLIQETQGYGTIHIFDDFIHDDMDRYPLTTNQNTTMGQAMYDALGEYTVGMGYDANKGQYVSMYDLWDLAPFGKGNSETLRFEKAGKADTSFGIGTPVQIYDRMYLDDYYGFTGNERGGYYLPEVTVTTNKAAPIKVGNVHVYDERTNQKSTGGPLYPFSFEKNPLLKTPVVRYDEGGQTYAVKKGDTFSQIAQNVGVSVQDLQKLNPTIKNVNRIREGQNINIPAYMFSEIFNTPQFTSLFVPQVQRTQPLQQQNTPIQSVVVPTQKGLKTAGPLDLQELAVRQAYTESALRPGIVNPKGAYGLFQIMQPALDDYNRVNKTNYTLEDMKNADNNIKVRNWYMNYLSNLGFINKGDIQSDSVGMYKVLASFNAGAGNVKDALTRAKADGKDIYDSWDWVSYLWDEPREYADFILRGIETKGTNKNEFDYKAISTAKSGTANKIRSSVKQ